MNLDQLTWKKQFLSEENAVIIDVRTPEEFDISRIPNSINIDFYNPKNFMQEIIKFEKDIPLYVYCRTGIRSSNSCQLMIELGFKNVYNLIGGIVEWNGEVNK